MADGDRLEKMLPCLLSHEECENKGKALAHVYDRYCEVEAEKKVEAAAAKEELDACRAQMNLLRTQIKTGHESRAVLCAWVYDWNKGKRSLVRQDIGEVIDEQAIPSEELQGNLALS